MIEQRTLLLFYCFHNLHKVKHLVRSLISTVFFVIGHFVISFKVFTPKLIYLKAALINVKMNVTFLKIGGAGLPNYSFGVKSLHCLPSAVSDPLTMRFGGYEQNFKLVVMRFLINFQYNTADTFAVNDNTIAFIM